MDEKLKRKLDEVLNSDRSQIRNVEQKRNEEAETQAAFFEEFLKKRESVIVPAFNEFSDYIQSHGWTGALELLEEQPERKGHQGRIEQPAQHAGARLVFYRGNTRPISGPGPSIPQFAISCDKRGRKASFYESTIGPNHGGSGGPAIPAKLEELTVEFVQQRLVAYFQKLIRDARPYDRI